MRITAIAAPGAKSDFSGDVNRDVNTIGARIRFSFRDRAWRDRRRADPSQCRSRQVIWASFRPLFDSRPASPEFWSGTRCACNGLRTVCFRKPQAAMAFQYVFKVVDGYAVVNVMPCPPPFR
jgi:hypothetical protein